jgi:hypothetical protein
LLRRVGLKVALTTHPRGLLRAGGFRSNVLEVGLIASILEVFGHGLKLSQFPLVSDILLLEKLVFSL